MELREDANLRDKLAEEHFLPCFSAYRRFRPFLFLGLIPPIMLFELDRELAADQIPGAKARLVLDLVLVLICGRDLTQKLPRHPRVTAIVFFGAGARLALLIAKSCGKAAHPLIYAASFLAALTAALVIWKSPSRERVLRELHAALDLPLASSSIEVPQKRGSLARALPIAVLLPFALVVSAHYGGLWSQALVLVVWGTALPQLATREVDDPRPRRSAYFSGKTAIAWTAVGIALTAGLTGGAHYLVDTIAAVIACTHGAAASHATDFMAKETTEVVRNVRYAREDVAFFMMTVFVAPLFEERIYRGMLQRIAGERFGPKRGVALAAVLFGLAHLGVYRVAIYQTILLGVSFGVAFEEGGIIAAIATHTIWNLYLLL